MSKESSVSAGAGRGWARHAPIAAIVLVAAAWVAFARDTVSFETLRENRAALLAWRDENIFLAAAVYGALYVAVVACSLPGALWMTVGAGFLFGVAGGTALSLLAATLGATLIFLAARSSLGDALKRRAGPWLARLRKGFENNEASVMLVLRLIPAVPFFIANLAPAFLGARLSTFVWTTLLGAAPATAIFAWVGAGLGDVFDQGGRPDPYLLFEPYVAGPLLGLAALSALPILARAIRPKAARLASEPLASEHDAAV